MAYTSQQVKPLDDLTPMLDISFVSHVYGDIQVAVPNYFSINHVSPIKTYVRHISGAQIFSSLDFTLGGINTNAPHLF